MWIQRVQKAGAGAESFIQTGALRLKFKPKIMESSKRKDTNNLAPST